MRSSSLLSNRLLTFNKQQQQLVYYSQHHSLSTQLKSIFLNDHHQPLKPSSIDNQNYLNQLSQSLNSQSYHQLSSPAFSQILNHLQSNDLFKYLSPKSYNLLLDFNPTTEQTQSIQSTHYYLYHRIIFLLDRIYEHQHHFSPTDLHRFHSIALKRLAHLGLFRPAELIWDQLIQPSSQPITTIDDQILMLDCIRTAIINHHQDSSSQTTHHQDSQSSSSSSSSYAITDNTHHSHQELLPLSSKDLKRMISLTESIANSLLTSTTNRIARVTERWAVRTVAEIFGIQGERTRLTDWLNKHRSLQLDFPDNGASWSDPKLTAIVVRMFKDQGRLEKMIMIYEAALHPSSSMLTHSESSNQFFTSEPLDLQHSSNRKKPQPGLEPKKKNPILTRTYHDLISACTQANRPHLALHYLSEAVKENETYVERLPTDPELDPPVPHLRLQPATYAELIPNLVRKKRDTQLRKVHELSERLVRTTVAELQWIRLHVAARAASPGLSEQDSRRWDLVLAAIVPQLSSHNQPDMETSKTENLALEKAVFTHANQPSLGTGEPEPLDQQPHQLTDQSEDPQDEISFLRTLERAKFLSKSLTHSVRLIQRLNHLIDKTRINRDIRFQHHLLKKKKKKSSHAPPTFTLSGPTSPSQTHTRPPRNPSSSAHSSVNHLRTLQRLDALIDQKNSLRFNNNSS